MIKSIYIHQMLIPELFYCLLNFKCAKYGISSVQKRYIHQILIPELFYCLLNFQCANYGISLVQKGQLKIYKV